MSGHFQEFEDEYLETMYEFHEQHPHGLVRTGDLASRLGVSPASATEMVQRLAERGLLEYIPYKGVKLTEDGLQHGQKMKRRHRLAEVLLDMLPYQGDAHQTACRLEHAIDDDLEVALSYLIRHDSLDPSGRPIPAATDDIAARIHAQQVLMPLHDLRDGEIGIVKLVLLESQIFGHLQEAGFEVGSEIEKSGTNFTVNGQHVLQVSTSISKGIFLQLSSQRA